MKKVFNVVVAISLAFIGLVSVGTSAQAVVTTTNTAGVFVRLDAPRNLRVTNSLIATGFGTMPDETFWSLPVNYFSAGNLNVKVTEFRITVTEPDGSVTSGTATSLYSNIITIEPYSVNYLLPVGQIDLQSFVASSGPSTNIVIDITLSEVSTFNWEPIRAKFESAGLSPAPSGRVQRDITYSNGTNTDFENPSGAYLHVCNTTAAFKFIRIKQVRFNDRISTTESGEQTNDAVLEFEPRECFEVWLGQTENQFGQSNVAVDATFGNAFNFEYANFDNFLKDYHLERTGSVALRFETLPDNSFSVRASIPVCNHTSIGVGPTATTTYVSYDPSVSLPNSTLDDLGVTPEHIITGSCSKGESTSWQLPDIAPAALLHTVTIPSEAISIGITSPEHAEYKGPSAIQLKRISWNKIRADLLSLGLTPTGRGRVEIDQSEVPKITFFHNACNQTNTRKHVIVKITTLGNLQQEFSPRYSRSVATNVAASGCAEILVGQIIGDYTTVFDNDGQVDLESTFGPEVLFDTSALDTALNSLGMTRTGEVTVSDLPDEIDQQVVQVPVCNRIRKDKPIYVGASRIGSGSLVWNAHNDEVQMIPSACPTGGNSLVLGIYDTSTALMDGRTGALTIEVPQIAHAWKSSVDFSVRGAPAGTTFSASTSTMTYSYRANALDIGVTDFWADVNVPLANKAKSYSITGLRLAGSAVATPVQISGPCKTVLVAKKKMCQRRVKLGQLAGNWTVGHWLMVEGTFGLRTVRTR